MTLEQEVENYKKEIIKWQAATGCTHPEIAQAMLDGILIRMDGMLKKMTKIETRLKPVDSEQSVR